VSPPQRAVQQRHREQLGLDPAPSAALKSEPPLYAVFRLRPALQPQHQEQLELHPAPSPRVWWSVSPLSRAGQPRHSQQLELDPDSCGPLGTVSPPPHAVQQRHPEQLWLNPVPSPPLWWSASPLTRDGQWLDPAHTAPLKKEHPLRLVSPPQHAVQQRHPEQLWLNPAPASPLW